MDEPVVLPKEEQYCHAGSDGDCYWEHCPQDIEMCPLLKLSQEEGR